MKTISKIIRELLNEGEKPIDIANRLGVSIAMISVWKNKDNDFIPRLNVAKKIYKEFGYITYPYAEEALKD